MQLITPTAVETAIPNQQVTNILAQLLPWQITIIILGTLAALLISLYMVYSYINNIRITDIYRQMLYDSVFAAQYQIQKDKTSTGRSKGYDDPDKLEEERRKNQSLLDQSKNRVAELENLKSRSIIEERDLAEQKNNVVYYADDLSTGDHSEERIKKLREQKQQQELELNEQDKKNLETATKFAKTLVPDSLTVAGMGITGSFFIELTAILTIIFGIIILGLVGILATAEIAPILAAIAGYVLGKTTSSGAYPSIITSSQQIPTPQAPLPLSAQTEGEEKSLPAPASNRSNQVNR